MRRAFGAHLDTFVGKMAVFDNTEPLLALVFLIVRSLALVNKHIYIRVHK